jgi:hypothetical protein
MTNFAFIGQAVVGWLLADLFSGVVHWLEDRVLPTNTPILGPAIVAPNRLHHVDQLAFTRSSVLSRNIWLWGFVALISGGLWLAGTPAVLLTFLTLGGLVVTEVQVRAHRPAIAGPAVRLLQEIGIIQSPRHHAGHHRVASARYCSLTDYLNPILDRTGVWAGLERALEWMHLEPSRGAT